MFLSRLLRLLLRPILVLILSAPVILLLLSVQTGATVTTVQPLSGEEISRIQQLLLNSAPESPASAGVQQLQLNADELNLLLRYSIDVMKLSPGWAAQLSLNDDVLNTRLSVNLTNGLVPLFLNIQGRFVAKQDLLELESLHIGKLQVPNRFLHYFLTRLRNSLLSSSGAYQDFSELVSRVESVAVSSNRMDVALQWDPDLISRIRNQAQQLFISEQDRLRIMSHYRQIFDVVATIPADLRAVSLNAFLIPLFSAAHDKSLNGSDPIAENRTLFQTLAIYVNDEDIEQLIGAELAQQLTTASFIEVRLQRRQDLAQHLVSIAAITASAGAEIAEMLSTTKEAYDARYRSGFSFSDLTANSVGVTMASLSTRDVSTALKMQQRIANLQSESDYMPEVGSNRDGLSETVFNALYHDRNSQEYQQRLRQIQQLIDARPLYQGL